MPEGSFKTRLKNLSFMKKMILIGSGVMLISAFLPWYQDIDRFNTGDMFLGVTGPMYLVGLIVFLASAISFGMIALRLFEKPVPKLPIEEDHFHIFASGLTFFMLILASSVYFHNKFGVNITDKAMGFGMILEFVGAGLLMAGGILNVRRKGVNFDTEGKIEPLINLNQERSQGEIERKATQESLIQESIDKITNDIR